MTITLAILIATSLVNLTLGALIYVRNPKGKVNQIFAYFALFIVTWTFFNYLADAAPTHNLLFTRLTFLAIAPLVLSVYFLSLVFPTNNKRNSSRIIWAECAISVGVAILSLTPLLVHSVTKTTSGVNLKIAVGYPIYIAFILQILGLGIYNFIKSYRTSSSVAKSQVKLLLTGIISYSLLAITSNLILPLILDSWSSSKYGPIFTLFFVVFTAYSIVKHRFLDIRLIAARSLGYILSLSTLAILFAVITLSITNLFFSNSDLNQSSVKTLYTVFAVVLAVLFPPLKTFFDKGTARIFYRDGYDSQAFLETFNKILVSTYDFNPLLRKSSRVIQDTLKPGYCAFTIKETENIPRRILGTAGHPNFSEDEIAKIRAITPQLHRKMLITDDLEAKNEGLQSILQANNIAVIARLSATTEEEGMGYLILGPKKSGNMFSAQDIKVIEIVTNELVIAVQNALHTEEIELFNITLQEKVNDATRKLRRTNEKLKQLDETKDDFISMASHQLRTPLTSVKGYISMVLEEDAGKITATQRDMLGQAFFGSQRMVYLIADLLNVSRLKTGKFIIEPAPIQLDQIVQQELRQLQETAAARSLTLQFDKPETFPTMMLDETKTRQIIMNFIDNAIYYTPAGGHIIAQLIDNEHSVELRVKDNGIGVPKNERQHLFTKFYRAGNARQARPDGTGLGLYMAKKVIIAQGGSLIFDSEEGKGSTFGFVFSKSLAATPDPLAPVVELPVPPLARDLSAIK